MILRCLFHIHTWHSLDCLVSPRKVLTRVRRAGAQILVVTDHETALGSEALMRIAHGNPRFVIRSSELKTEKGDLIGLFLNKEIRSRNSNDVLREIRRQGGLAVLPHPYKGHQLDDELLQQIDLVETFNGRCSVEQNESAKKLACRLNKPEIAGCDAHSAAEIGAAYTEFEVEGEIIDSDLPGIFRTAQRRFVTAPGPRIYQPYSGLIKACRTLDVSLFGYQLKRVIAVASKELFSC